MAAHGARRLLAMAENAADVIGIELSGRRAGLRLPRAADVERAARARRGRCCARACRTSTTTAILRRDIAAAAALVRSGALVAAAGADLPWTEGAT